MINFIIKKIYCCIIEYILIIKFECIIIKKYVVHNNFYPYDVIQYSKVTKDWTPLL